MKIKLHKGDIFATENSQGFVGKLINFFQKNYNRDGKSKYTHAGLVIDECGVTFEALPSGYKRQNLFTAYEDKQIVIFRSKGMTNLKFTEGFHSISGLEGKWYPWHRIPLFIFPPLSTINLVSRPVCSESVMKFMFNAGVSIAKGLIDKIVSHVGRRGIYGVDPDDVVDMCREDRNYTVVFEGKLNTKEEV